MDFSKLEIECRLKSRNQLIFCAIALLCIIIASVNTSAVRFWRNAWLGSKDFSAEQLQGIRDIETEDRNWISVNGEKAIDLGLINYKVIKKFGVEIYRYKESVYFVIKVGDRWLLVKGEQVQKHVEGELSEFYDSLKKIIFKDTEMQKLEPAFYPFILRQGDVKQDGLIRITIIMVLLAVTVWFGFWSTMGLINPKKRIQYETKKDLKSLIKSAEKDNTQAQIIIGLYYQIGLGVDSNFVEAYAWLNLAAKKDDAAAKAGEELEIKMSPQQIAEAQKRVEELRSLIDYKINKK